MQDLDHRNVAKVLDAGEVAHASYIVIEYLGGGDLKERLAAGIEPDDVVEIVCRIGDALTYAHGEGFVHRDVKPENILFRDDGTAVLSDFGIAKALHEGARATATGMSIGTPYYMSPEQARGDAITAATDFYALGVVLFEALAGHRPYDAATPLPSPFITSTRPSRRSLRSTPGISS